jgi:hypothetical protein
LPYNLAQNEVPYPDDTATYSRPLSCVIFGWHWGRMTKNKVNHFNPISISEQSSFMSRNLYFSRGIFKFFRGSYLSELARYMPEDYSKFDTLEQDNVARKVI